MNNLLKSEIKTTLQTLDKWEEFIFENEELFLETFSSYDKTKHHWKLISISWSSENVDFLYLEENGASIVDGCKIEEWLDFFKENNKRIKSGNVKMKEFEKCEQFLLRNDWERSDDVDEYKTFIKPSSIAIYLSEEEFIFVDDSGDFLRRDVDYFTLIGALIHCRLIPFTFKDYA